MYSSRVLSSGVVVVVAEKRRSQVSEAGADRGAGQTAAAQRGGWRLPLQTKRGIGDVRGSNIAPPLRGWGVT